VRTQRRWLTLAVAVLHELAGAARIGWRVTGTDPAAATTAGAVIQRF